MLRIGHGFDVHRLQAGESLILNGVELVHYKGTVGHSDADVCVHAVIDAVLGALALGDIGQLFPDNDAAYKGADSLKLLKQVLTLDAVQGWVLNNLDLTIIAQEPKLAAHIPQMRQNLASVFACDVNQISVKATTTERLGYCGREEGIAAHAVLILTRE